MVDFPYIRNSYQCFIFNLYWVANQLYLLIKHALNGHKPIAALMLKEKLLSSYPKPSTSDLGDESFYKEFLETLPDVAIQLTEEGIIEWLNASGESFFEWLPIEMTGRSFNQFCLDKPRLASLLAQLKENGVVRNFALPFATRSGQQKTGELHLRYHPSTSLHAARITGTLRDITVERQLQDEVTEVKTFYQTVLNAIAADIAVFDHESRYRFLNQHAVKNPEMREWLIGKTDTEYCLERGKDPSIGEQRAAMHQALLTSNAPVQWIEELDNKAGDKQFILRMLTSFKDSHDEAFIIGYGLDVTSLKNTEQELLNKEAYLRSLLHSLPDNIVRINWEGRFVDVTANNAEDMPFPQDQLRGRTLHDLLPAEAADAYLMQVRQVLYTGEAITTEQQRPDLKGTLNYYEDRIIKTSDNEAVIIIRNINAQRDYERRILTAAVQSEEQERNRIAGELHDGVCQELTAAKLTIEMAEAMAATENAHFAQMLAKSKGIILNALNSIRRASHQLMSDKLNELGFTGMLEAMVSELDGVDCIAYHLQVEGIPVEPEKVIATNVIRIIQEFIRNSQKHSGTKEVTIRLRFSERRLLIAIRDFGKGFSIPSSKEHQGIGIFNMLNRVKTIGGHYKLDTGPGKGVRLVVSVPVGETRQNT